jgi:hypothetical protein
MIGNWIRSLPDRAEEMGGKLSHRLLLSAGAAQYG